MARPADDTVEHGHVAVLADRGGERLAERACDIERPEARRDRALDHPAEPFLIERAEDVGNQPRGAAAQAAVARAGRAGKEPPGRSGEIDPAHPPRHHPRHQEVGAQEARETVADPVLVARDDRGVRDRQAERVAEQGGDREPVGEPADHRRLGECADEAPAVRAMLEQAGERIEQGHRDEQPGGGNPHPADAALRGVEAMEPGPGQQIHAGRMAGSGESFIRPPAARARARVDRRWSAAGRGAPRAISRYRRRG